MITVNIRIEIDHPAEETFRFISNFENNPLWQSGMDSCRIITAGPLRLGTKYEQEAHFLGKTITSRFEVVEYIPNERIKAKSIESTFPITFERSVRGDAERSLVEARIEGEPKGMFRLAKPILRWMVNRSIQADYRELKRILESQ